MIKRDSKYSPRKKWRCWCLYIPVCLFSNHAGSLMLLLLPCILQPFSFRDGWRDGGMEGWRDGGRGGGQPNSQSDGWRKGRAEGWCRKTREAPEGNCREEKRWKEKPREAPLQLRRIPSSLHCSSCNLITNCCQTSHSMHQLSYMCNNPEPGITVRLWAVLHQEHKPWIKIRRLTFW